MARRHSQPGIEPDKPRRKKATVLSRGTGSSIALRDIPDNDPNQNTVEWSAHVFIQQALERFNQAADAEIYNRMEGLVDALMVEGDGQWDDDIRARRQRKKRPCLTINRFRPMIDHVVNEERVSRTAIKVEAVGGGADPISASIRQGLIRHIEVVSDAEIIYDTAFERMVEKGWSWFRIVTDWESPTSFQQVIRIEGFTNDFCVYSDPTSEDPSGKDKKWAFVVQDMPRGEYAQQYPNSRARGMMSFETVGDTSPWITPETIRVVEYYYLDEVPVDVVQLLDGTGVYQDEIEERAGLWWYKAELDAYDDDKLAAEALREVPVDLDENGRFRKTRPSYRTKLKWAKINAVEVLEGDFGKDAEKNTCGREIAGKYIPLVMVTGRSRMINGRLRLSGMVRNNRDAQRMYNYAISAFVEMIALAPKSPFIAAMSQIQKYKAIWDSANEENWPYLPYDPKSADGNQAVPPPQRTEYNPQVGALIQAIREFDNDLKIGFNIFDPTLGQPRADQSGRAVASLQQRSESANMHWHDNMRRAKIYAGEIILEMIPVVYDASRIITIVRPDNEAEELVINQEFQSQDGKLVNHDMAVGKYSCTLSLGEYASKRQQAVTMLSQIAQKVPEVALPLLPLILDNMDSPMAKEAKEIVERLQPDALKKPGSPEQMQAQMRKIMQQHELLVDALEKANRVIETKELDNETKKLVATIQARAMIAIAAAKIDSADGIAKLNAEYKKIGDDAERLYDAIQQDQTRTHEKELAQMEPAGASA